MFNSCIYNIKGVRAMERTYVDRIAEYYDNLDRIIDWEEDIDLRVYDPNNWVKDNVIQLG